MLAPWTSGPCVVCYWSGLSSICVSAAGAGLVAYTQTWLEHELLLSAFSRSPSSTHYYFLLYFYATAKCYLFGAPTRPDGALPTHILDITGTQTE